MSEAQPIPEEDEECEENEPEPEPDPEYQEDDALMPGDVEVPISDEELAAFLGNPMRTDSYIFTPPPPKKPEIQLDVERETLTHEREEPKPLEEKPFDFETEWNKDELDDDDDMQVGDEKWKAWMETTMYKSPYEDYVPYESKTPAEAIWDRMELLDYQEGRYVSADMFEDPNGPLDEGPIDMEEIQKIMKNMNAEMGSGPDPRE